MQVGDLVKRKTNPQGTWLITKMSQDGNWFIVHGYARGIAWFSVNEYEVIN